MAKPKPAEKPKQKVNLFANDEDDEEEEVKS